jgi:uncharacterized membrane protein
VTGSTAIRALFVASIALYPFLVYVGLQHLPPSFFALVLLLLLGLRFGILLPDERPVLVPILLLFVVYALVAAVAGSQKMLLYYPVVVNFSLCGVFLASLRGDESLLLRLVRSRGRPMSKYAPRYLHRLTIVWSVFFALNGLIAAWTTTLSIQVWTLYNGLLSYCLVAVLMIVEYVFRRYYKRRMGVDS